MSGCWYFFVVVVLGGGGGAGGDRGWMLVVSKVSF